jgi:hypothetical protein
MFTRIISTKTCLRAGVPRGEFKLPLVWFCDLKIVNFRDAVKYLIKL